MAVAGPTPTAAGVVGFHAATGSRGISRAVNLIDVREAVVVAVAQPFTIADDAVPGTATAHNVPEEQHATREVSFHARVELIRRLSYVEGRGKKEDCFS